MIKRYGVVWISPDPKPNIQLIQWYTDKEKAEKRLKYAERKIRNLERRMLVTLVIAEQSSK